MIREKAKELSYGKMDVNMRAIGKTENSMA